MNLELQSAFQTFLKERHFEAMIAQIQSSPTWIDELLTVSETATDRERNYASWLLLHYFERYPDDFNLERTQRTIRLFLTDPHHAVQRNTAGMLYNAHASVQENGEVLGKTFDHLSHPNSLPALNYQCLRLMDKWFLPAYPELKMELMEVLEGFKERKEPSMKSMYKKYVAKFGGKG